MPNVHNQQLRSSLDHTAPDQASLLNLLTGDRRQARHFYLAKQFYFLDADCLVMGESQGSSRRSVGKYPVKPPRPEGDSQTIGTYRCKNH